MHKTHKDLQLLLWDEDESFVMSMHYMLSHLGIGDIQVISSQDNVLPALETAPPDILFVGLELKTRQKSAIDLVEQIRTQGYGFPVVFLVTDPSRYEQALFNKLQPTSLMQKELSKTKLQQTLEMALLQYENVQLKQQLAKTPSILHLPSPPSPSMVPSEKAPHIFFRIGDAYKRLSPEQISYFYADNKLTYARVGNRNYPTNVQLKTLEDSLSPHFLRCHKKYLVNVEKIESILVKEHKLKIEEETLSIGYAYRKEFFDHLHLLK